MIFRGLSKDFQRVFREFLNDYKDTKIISLKFYWLVSNK